MWWFVVIQNSFKNFKVIFSFLISLFIIFYSLSYKALSREEKILERIKPLGTVNLTAGAVADSGTKPVLSKDAGLKRYKSTCYICHDTGASGAPKLGDAAAWSARIKKGKETLYTHANKGLNAMPPKGGCLTCSDEEITMTVDYMLQKSQ
jgi:cytochrome c5